jgi:CTP synthase
VGTDRESGLVEFIEIADHPYFVATQAHPEFTSRLERPHPLFVGLIRVIDKM